MSEPDGVNGLAFQRDGRLPPEQRIVQGKTAVKQKSRLRTNPE
jgi:hypothetical protein